MHVGYVFWAATWDGCVQVLHTRQEEGTLLSGLPCVCVCACMYVSTYVLVDMGTHVQVKVCIHTFHSVIEHVQQRTCQRISTPMNK